MYDSCETHLSDNESTNSMVRTIAAVRKAIIVLLDPRSKDNLDKPAKGESETSDNTSEHDVTDHMETILREIAEQTLRDALKQTA